MKQELMKILYLVAWGDMSRGGLEFKERALIKMRDIINKELKVVRKEIKKLGDE